MDAELLMGYQIVDVPLGAATQLEQLGTKSKFWFDGPDGTRALFKEGRTGTGENWAEKACCEIARLLGLPHAEYELALHNGRPGTVSPSFVPKDGRLIHGNELLSKIHVDYETHRNFGASQHTVRRVIAELRHVAAPMGWACPVKPETAAGVFVGYLLLDALIGNQDRHHENWGIINRVGKGLFLAPTFDHAGSLGRNESDEKRTEMLTTRDMGRSVEHYVTRARSGLYESPASCKPLTTLGAFLEGRRLENTATLWWLERLESVSIDSFEIILSHIPSLFISEPARKFALGVLKANRDRLLTQAEILK